jgi:hypothetical protein
MKSNVRTGPLFVLHCFRSGNYRVKISGQLDDTGQSLVILCLKCQTKEKLKSGAVARAMHGTDYNCLNIFTVSGLTPCRQPDGCAPKTVGDDVRSLILINPQSTNGFNAKTPGNN